MSHYISCHTISCMTRQQIDYLQSILGASPAVRLRRMAGNQITGKLLFEFEADSREALEELLGGHNVHYDWLMTPEFDQAY